MRKTHRSVISLQAGCWFKLIGGASYQHLPAIRNLALAFTLAGADCIDVAADPAVVKAVKESFRIVSRLPQLSELGAELASQTCLELPLLMISLSDGEDPHFRKARFDPQQCPADCPRPCEAICPAAAIAFTPQFNGVIEERCYGCGRCMPICPVQQIDEVTRATSVESIAASLLAQVDAIEIHTQVGRYDQFRALWSALRPYVDKLSLISISCPNHAEVTAYLWQLYDLIQPLKIPLIWQTDGRPMSGDMGHGTTRVTLRYAEKVLREGPPGYVQLAGGTNDHTAAKLGPLKAGSAAWPSLSATEFAPIAPSRPQFGGVAFGSFARRLLSAVWAEEATAPLFASTTVPVDERPSFYDPSFLKHSILQLQEAVQLAQGLVAPIKDETYVGGSLSLPTGRDRRFPMAAPAELPYVHHQSSNFS
ncbi:MAG: LdpA C-terminal domain-containing domain [Cyanobacteria bacterium P01_C01_bin.120]